MNVIDYYDILTSHNISDKDKEIIELLSEYVSFLKENKIEIILPKIE